MITDDSDVGDADHVSLRLVPQPRETGRRYQIMCVPPYTKPLLGRVKDARWRCSSPFCEAAAACGAFNGRAKSNRRLGKRKLAQSEPLVPVRICRYVGRRGSIILKFKPGLCMFC